MQVPRFQVSSTLGPFLLTILLAGNAQATTQLLLSRDAQNLNSEYKGVVELTVNPGFDNARVTIVVDGQKLAEGIRSPHKVIVDFGPRAIEHKISVTAWISERKRVQWHATINRGMHPLSVTLRLVDPENRIFEAVATAPKEDPVSIVEIWDDGKAIASATEPPYRFQLPPAVIQGGFAQVTARTRSGDEAADFWSVTGDVHAEAVEVRTVPLFVSVVDRNGATRDDVDRSLFRILDNEAEGKIIEFGKAFDQPISIALLLDSSASMTYALKDATKAATAFVKKTLKSGDRCSVFAVRDVPRRMQELTDDHAAIEKGLAALTPAGRTALYDAISAALRDLKDEKNRRAIVVLTDGGDTASIASYEDISKLGRETGIPIYFIAYESGDESAVPEIDRLKHLAAETGGFVATASQQNLQAKYSEIERDLRAQFAIRYQVTDFTKRNEWRKIRVLLGSPKLVARTIRGYYAP